MDNADKVFGMRGFSTALPFSPFPSRSREKGEKPKARLKPRTPDQSVGPPGLEIRPALTRLGEKVSPFIGKGVHPMKTPSVAAAALLAFALLHVPGAAHAQESPPSPSRPERASL